MNTLGQSQLAPDTPFDAVQLRSTRQPPECEGLASENIDLRRKNTVLHEQIIMQGFFHAERDVRNTALESEIRTLKLANGQLRSELNKIQAQLAGSKIAHIKLRHAIAIARREKADYLETNERLQTMLDVLVAAQPKRYHLRNWLETKLESGYLSAQRRYRSMIDKWRHKR